MADHEVRAEVAAMAAVAEVDANEYLTDAVQPGQFQREESALQAKPSQEMAAPSVPEASTTEVPTEPASVEAAPATGVHFFGPQDPHLRARHLARALISDIVAYYPERLERSRADSNVQEEFREEILKSWEEFVLQVGDEFARETEHFQTALNDILARGAETF
jgi:hypothetical protein